MSMKTIVGTLLATEAAQRCYLTSPDFRRAVDLVRQAERDGRDPWEAMREVLVAGAVDKARLIDRLVAREMLHPSAAIIAR